MTFFNRTVIKAPEELVIFLSQELIVTLFLEEVQEIMCMDGKLYTRRPF